MYTTTVCDQLHLSTQHIGLLEDVEAMEDIFKSALDEMLSSLPKWSTMQQLLKWRTQKEQRRWILSLLCLLGSISTAPQAKRFDTLDLPCKAHCAQSGHLVPVIWTFRQPFCNGEFVADH